MATAAIVIITLVGLHIAFWAYVAIKAFWDFEDLDNDNTKINL